MFDLSNLFLVLLVSVCRASPTVRQTANRPVEGVEQLSSLGQKFYAFKGIPYAEPPITGIDPYTGATVNRRFKAPVPLKRKWSNNLKADNFGDVCIPSIHLFELKSKSSEDCLFLNVYVPADDYTGNMGLKDQQMALKWAYDNIDNFSGDKDKILLFGVSAGGSSINFHLLNQESRKYFTRAFISSGTAFSYFALSEGNHLERMQNFSKIIDKNELIEYLKTADRNVLAECSSFMGFERLLSTAWTPVIENTNVKGAFITNKPDEIHESGGDLAMDVLFSFTSREYITFDPNPSMEPILNGNTKVSDFPLPFKELENKLNPNNYEQAVKLLREAYSLDLTNKDAIKSGNVDLISDMNFGYSVLRALIAQITINSKYTSDDRKNTFLFRFALDAGLNVFKVKYNMEYDGAGHVDDLCYVFYCHMLDEAKIYDEHLKSKDESYEAIMRMVELISNFARTGNPSIKGDTPFKSCTSENEVYCQEISNNSTSTVTKVITQQLFYQTWRKIENLYTK